MLQSRGLKPAQELCKTQTCLHYSLLDPTQVAEPCLDMWGCLKGGFQLSCRENLSSLQFSMSHLPIPLLPSQIWSRDASKISVNDSEVVSNQPSKRFSKVWPSLFQFYLRLLCHQLVGCLGYSPGSPVLLYSLGWGQWLMMALSLVHSSAPHL